MSQASTPVTASSIQTPPAATAARTATPIGVAATPSTIRPAAESPSCLSQIGSMISSIVSSIFSLISSLWNRVTGQSCIAITSAPHVRTPADIFVEQARTFFNDGVSQNIPAEYPRKIALLITVDGQKVGVFTQNLQIEQGTTIRFNELSIWATAAYRFLEATLRRQASLTAESTVKLCVMDLKRQTEPDGTDLNTLGSYNTFSTTLSSVDERRDLDINHENATETSVGDALQNFNNTAFSGCSLEEERFRTLVLHFFQNSPDARTGWFFR
jgi:hypothetical protein